GKLLANGTPDEILHLFPLATWSVGGPAEKLAALSPRLEALPGVSHVTAFGNTLHVTGENQAALESAIAPFFDQGLSWQRSQPSLEDVFIHLMARVSDNFQ